MNEIICYTSLLSPGEAKHLDFWDILLDDRWTEGGMTCPDNIYLEIGYVNKKLHAKQYYEFLLRAASQFPIIAVGQENTCAEEYDSWDAFCTDCYIIGKYQVLLRENNYFESIVTQLLQQAMQMPWKESGITFLENMISQSQVYYDIDDNTKPILLYRGSDFCQNLLNYFIDALAIAFRKCHQRVEIFDSNLHNTNELTKYIGQHFKAIIGIQAPLFAQKMADRQTYLHDLIIAPKYNMVLDHPAWLKDELLHSPSDYYLLLHDRNYIKFSATYYSNLSGYYHLPPAGLVPNASNVPMEHREYDVSFIGSYRDYRQRLAVLYTYDRPYRHLAAKYIKILRQHPDYTGEQALKLALQYFNFSLNDRQYLDFFYEMRQVYFCVLLYYKEKVIKTLLDGGLQIHVYSESWKDAPFHKHPNLICHPEVDALESLHIMQNSKISLNIMSWHKDGLTERIFNGMLCQSVVLSDNTTALQEQFVDNEDIVLFSLSELTGLPSRIKSLLADYDKLQAIAENGYKKALAHHTWQQRAEYLVNIFDSNRIG